MENLQQKSSVSETINYSNQQESNVSNGQVVKVGDWMLTIFISGIPLVGFIMLFVWAFGSTENKSKQNWAKANLIWLAVGAAMVALFWGLIVSLIASGK